MKQEKNFYIIAGPNGAGKTTLSKVVLRDIFKCNNFINADEIAKGLSPINNRKFDIEAGKLMLKKINYHFNLGEDCCIETTLSSVLYLKKIKEFRKAGYKTKLFFLYLPSEEKALQRVAQRVQHGGHNIEEKVVRRRYKTGLENLMNKYYDLVDELYIYKNQSKLTKIACKIGKKLDIYEHSTFENIQKYKND